jgi:hypothetical protein
MVAYYGNYIIVISKLISLFSAITSSIGASIGNLVAEGNKEKILKIFWEITTIQHTIAAIISFSIYTFLEPFIAHWLGPNYIMDHKILFFLVIFIYISNSRSSVDGFNYAYGLYADVWSAWAELIINISITIVFGIKWGIIGILMGKISSLSTIVVFWKPYYLFSEGFKEPVIIYWKGVLRNYAISLGAFISSHFIIRIIPINPYKNLWEWCVFCSISITIFLVFEFFGNYFFARGAKDIINHVINIRRK